MIRTRDLALSYEYLNSCVLATRLQINIIIIVIVKMMIAQNYQNNRCVYPLPPDPDVIMQSLF